jgi:hypothetical protein
VPTTDKIYFIRGDGGSIDLTDHLNYDVLWGVNGRWMPPYNYTSEYVYTYPGQVLRIKQTAPRVIDLPIKVMGSSIENVRENLRALNNAFSYDLGSGKLKVVTADGKTRMINLYYSDGMGFQETSDTAYPSVFYMFSPEFTAFDPYWYDPLENEVWLNATAGEIGESSINSKITLYNEGDVPAWPVWSLTGAFTECEIQNLTTGALFDLQETVPTSQRVYLDTRPGNHNVLRNHVTVDYGNLTTDSKLFPLVPGPNEIVPIFTNSDANTELRVRWVNKYLGV